MAVRGNLVEAMQGSRPVRLGFDKCLGSAPSADHTGFPDRLPESRGGVPVSPPTVSSAARDPSEDRPIKHKSHAVVISCVVRTIEL